MYIDTNREPSNYQDDYYVDTKSAYSRLKQEKQELSSTRARMRCYGAWTWDLEIDYRDQMEYLTASIQEELGLN